MRSRCLIIAAALCLSLMATAFAGCIQKAETPPPDPPQPTALAEPEALFQADPEALERLPPSFVERLSPSFLERLAAITPYTPPPEPEYYYGGSVGDFFPSDDYGRVYPYIGGVQNAKPHMEGYWFNSSCLYGFVDESGRIICDPVYNGATLLTYGDKAAYVMRKCYYWESIPTSYWLAWDDNFSPTRKYYYIVVSLDGAFVGIYEDVYCDLSRGYPTKSYEFIAVKKSGRWGVIDYDGTAILPYKYYNAPLFSEGLAAVNENNSYYTNVPDEYYYIDRNGKRILGPFAEITSPFSHGRALCPKGEHCGFIDNSGKLVIPQIYDYYPYRYSWKTTGFDENGWAIVIVDGKGGYDKGAYLAGIIDINGKFVFPLSEVWDNFRGRIFIEGNYCFFYYDTIIDCMTGEVIENSDPKLEYRKCLAGDIFTTDAGIVNIKTGEFYYRGDTPYVNYAAVFEIWPEPNAGCEVIQIDGRPCVLGYLWDDEWIYADYDVLVKPKFGVLDQNGPVLDFAYDNLQWMGGYFCAVQGNYGGLIRPDGSWFVKVPLNYIFD